MTWEKTAILLLQVMTTISPAYAETSLRIDKKLSQEVKSTVVSRVCAKEPKEIPSDHSTLTREQIKSNKIPPCPQNKPIMALPRAAIPLLVGGAAIGASKVAVLSGDIPEAPYGEHKDQIDEQNPAASLREKIREETTRITTGESQDINNKEKNKKWYQKVRLGAFVIVSSTLTSLLIYSLDEESIDQERESKSGEE